MNQRLITSILLVIVVFSTGVIIGNTWRSSDAATITKILRQSELDAESFLVEQELFESFEANCQLSEKRLASQSQELWRLGKLLGGEDAKEKLGEPDYTFLKKKYHLMQARTYILAKKLQDDCGKQSNIILYYYQQNDPLSEQQGPILDELVDDYNLHVFAIELGYANELEFLEDYYAINKTPTLVVNFDTVLQGPATREQLTPHLQ